MRRDWVALVEGNPRLWECLFAAASGNRTWNVVTCDKLDNFFSRGVTSEGEAKSLLTYLLPMLESSGVPSENALRAACTSGGRKWLLKLLAKCLLGTEVRKVIDCSSPRGELLYMTDIVHSCGCW